MEDFNICYIRCNNSYMYGFYNILYLHQKIVFYAYIKILVFFLQGDIWLNLVKIKVKKIVVRVLIAAGKLQEDKKN